MFKTSVRKLYLWFAYYTNFLFLNNIAFRATITVLIDINIAATAGSKSIPLEANIPVASGKATTLYPVAQKIF